LHYVFRVFTGLVQTRGVVEKSGARLKIRCILGPLTLGESIAIEGACLTVAAFSADVFEVDASTETLSKTTLGSLAHGARVNLERALAVGDRMGGHIVTGHVDGVGSLASRAQSGESVMMSFQIPRELMRFIAKKGSIAISGVSLTINNVESDRIDVMIIPHTFKETTLGDLRVGDRVNVEVDLLARYIARLLEPGGDETLLNKLKTAGFFV